MVCASVAVCLSACWSASASQVTGIEFADTTDTRVAVVVALGDLDRLCSLADGTMKYLLPCRSIGLYEGICFAEGARPAGS